MHRVALHIDDESLLDRITAILADEAGIDLLNPVNPDVVITDHLPFSEAAPTIVLGDELSGFEMLKAGASGVLSRHIDASGLMLAVETVKRGFAILPRSGMGSGQDPSRDDLLTARELEVLRLLAEGASNKLIARKLGISFHTAKFHVASIAAKLDATGRTDAVAQAVRLGLILL